jgi:hypothetical protein
MVSPQFYAEILRGVGFHDDNFLVGWIAAGGVNASTDGDTLTLSGTTSTNGYSNSGLNVNAQTYNYLIVRMRAAAPMTVDFQTTIGATVKTVTFTLTTTAKTFTFSLATTGTITQLAILNQSLAGNIYVDEVAFCTNTPLAISQTDVLTGEDVRASLSVDVLQLKLNNASGKYMSGASSFGYADHLRVWAGASSLIRTFGGLVEWRQPERSPDDIIALRARGWGLALSKILVTKEYLNTTPQNMVKDFVNTFVNATGTGWQLTTNYVQNLGTAPLYFPFVFKPAFQACKEVGDLLVAQGVPVEIWVDPSENLHMAPLGAWGSDPQPSTYPTTIAVGANQILNQFAGDIESLVNRLHYFAIAQIPGSGDYLTENQAANWNYQNFGAAIPPGTESIVDITASPYSKAGSRYTDLFVSYGTQLVNINIQWQTPQFPLLDLSTLGSQRAPPVLDFYVRAPTNTPPGGVNTWNNPPTNVATWDKRIVLAGPNGSVVYDLTSILNNSPGVIDNTKLQHDTWYHVLLNIGPYGDDRFYVGASPAALNIWQNINYIGFRTIATASGGTQNAQEEWWVDGLRIYGARYRIAVDTRASPPVLPIIAGRREHMIFDPVTKDETAIKNIAQAELYRLRNPVQKGSFHVPILADLLPGQNLTINAPSANLNNATLRATKVTHHFSLRGFITEVECSDDFTSQQPIERFKLANMLLQSGHVGIANREHYDLKTASADPSVTAIVDNYP